MSTSPPSTDIPTLDASTYRRFGRTDLMVSPLGFGGSPIGHLETDLAIVDEILNTLLDHGVNLIDTAHVYHGSEEAIGAAVAARRDEYVLVSKCGSKWGDDSHPPAWSPEYITSTIDRSLERLRVDHIDVMLLHTCDLETLEKGDALGAVVAARDAGKIRHAGFSGDNETAAWAAAQPDIEVIQTSISMCDQHNVDRVLPVTGSHDVGVMAKRPVANGAWKHRDNQYEKYQRYAEPYHQRFESMGVTLDAVRAACNDEHIEWPEFALRFTLSLPGVHTAIVGTTHPGNTRGNLRAAARGPLPDPAVQLLRDAFHGADPNGEWDGLT